MLDLRYRSILAMAIPLMGSTFIQSVVLITDSAFLSRYDILHGTLSFDAAGNGGLVYITLFMALVGMSDGAQILMARRIGQKKEHLLARIFGTTLFTNFLLVLVLFSLIKFILPDFIEGYAHNEEIAQGQIDYINIRGYGLFFAMVSLSINAYFMAMGKTSIVFLSAIVTACSNIFLDYALIFGHFGMSEMGLEGAAIASTLSDGLGMVFLIVALSKSKSRKEHKLFAQLSYNTKSFKELLKLGTPILLQGIVALSTWTVFFAWIEQMGTHELTISQNIRSLYFIAFIPIFAFGATTKTYISQLIGSKQFDEIPKAIRRIQLMTIVFLFIFFHGALFYPEQLIRMINPEEAFLAESASILRYVGGSIFLFGFCSVYFHTINGSGNTHYTFYVELISVFAYILSAYLFIKVYHWDLYWVWTVEYIYFSVMGLFSFGYLKLFNWQKKQI
jgi:MATE family multidrug resistance protein